MRGQPGVRRWADTAPTPWRNGGGVTRELASSAAGEDPDWRISIAEVTASGAFSLFPGVDRTIVLLDGAGLTLIVDGTAHPLTHHRPFAFDGGRAVSCVVPAGATRVLNVMTRSGRCRAEVTVVDVVDTVDLPASDAATRLVVALADPVTVTAAGGHPLTLDRFDLHRAPAGAALALTGGGPVAVIGIHSELSAGTSGAAAGP